MAKIYAEGARNEFWIRDQGAYTRFDGRSAESLFGELLVSTEKKELAKKMLALVIEHQQLAKSSVAAQDDVNRVSRQTLLTRIATGIGELRSSA